MSEVEIVLPQEKNYHFGDILVKTYLYGERPKYQRSIKCILQHYWFVASFEEEEETRTLKFVKKMLREPEEFLQNFIQFNDYGVAFKAEEILYIDEESKYNQTEQNLWHIWDPIEVEDLYYGRINKREFDKVVC